MEKNLLSDLTVLYDIHQKAKEPVIGLALSRQPSRGTCQATFRGRGRIAHDVDLCNEMNISDFADPVVVIIDTVRRLSLMASTS